jgi:hypothetical protein
MFHFFNSAAGLILTISTLVAVLGGFYLRRVRPWLKEREQDRIAQRDALVGRPPVVDSITRREISPALPGIGQRMATIEDMVAELVISDRRHSSHEQHLAAHDKALATHDQEFADVDRRVKALEGAAVERVVSRAESTQAFRTIEAAIKATPDLDGDVEDD